MPTLQDYLRRLQELDWTVELKKQPGLDDQNPALRRYRDLPVLWLDFLRHVETCVHPKETGWFICEADYLGTSETAFAWNECEVQSLEAASEDPDIHARVKEFWASHCPIMFSTKSCYAHFSLMIGTNRVVRGCEPEYEEVSPVAKTFLEFVQKICDRSVDLAPYI